MDLLTSNRETRFSDHTGFLAFSGDRVVNYLAFAAVRSKLEARLQLSRLLRDVGTGRGRGTGKRGDRVWGQTRGKKLTQTR